MAIPDFQTVFEPLLKFASDGKEHNAKETRDQLALEFGLTEEELNQLLDSGKQTIFANRVGWAKSYLKKAGLLESTKRGCFKITERGEGVLADLPEKLNVKYLKQYPEFQKFHQSSPKTDPQPIVNFTDKTPEEALEEAHLNLRSELADELIQSIKDNTPDFFEKLVVQLIVKLGYGGSMRDVGQAVGKSGDEGIDGIIKEDKLGLDIIYIQAKRWEASVGRPEIQKFVGALHGQQAKKGIFISTSSFTSGAKDYASKIDTNVVLIDGEQLVDLMIDHNLGVSTVETYEVKKFDTDFFIED